MDPLGDVREWPLLPNVYGLLDIWHTNRTPIILLALCGLFVLRLYLHIYEDKTELKAIPKLYEKPVLKKTVNASQQEVQEKTTAKATTGPRRIKGGLVKKPETTEQSVDLTKPVKILVFFSSVTTKTEKIGQEYIQKLENYVTQLAAETSRQVLAPELLDLTEVDFDDYFIAPPKSDDGVQFLYLFLIPSYNIDSINDTFLEHLQETHHDFRIDTAPLAPLLGYSVFGFGDREGWPDEAEGYCFQAKELDRWMAKLTARKRAYPVGMGDMKSDHAQRFTEWAGGVEEIFGQIVRTGCLGEGVPGSGAAAESDDEVEEEDYDDGEVVFDDEKPVKRENGKKSSSLNDVEDLGRMIKSQAGEANPKAPIAVDFTTYNSKGNVQSRVKEMVAKNSPTYAALTKQGYAIVGSHSGVKICRWTKSALRGRGSCYKYSLYGINSHQCMETTPSLSCSNKCVFCWRHGTNPVGTTWRWVVDPPEMIFDGVKENHYKKIKMMRGVPGVRAERFAEALKIRHCALSLVGEPIFYPYINEFLSMLHKEHISSFLVCNAQHPDELANLKAVTQLYVSIDASNKDSLRKIDRPLHRDFWERFQRCLNILREKRFRHRTVFRLTLVKGFNVDDEVEGYAKLVEQGLPCFVEIKGVTYCGTSTSSNAGLSMSNVPFYWEVCEFVRALDKRLKEKGLDYGIAAEHAHSCCSSRSSSSATQRSQTSQPRNVPTEVQLTAETGEIRS
ncbi:hypothetical protein NQ176_g3408 [Zarea fungicola]|uniref:Uncharacterized protein n=1 Tax=Zarea fungicola TaxID=93591 RepID=A0ACC1NIM8_9HYPO|nr:hypothetical protein NQ176_g3408 [Lecanicillium fungicola]